MEIIILLDKNEVHKDVAGRIQDVIRSKPASVLGLATGRTMLGVYGLLREAYKQKEVDFAEVTTFNLDEYLGIDEKDPENFRFYMEENLFKHINIKAENTFLPSPFPVDIDQECEKYEKTIEQKGGIDLQLLGIGRDGHIGFNEPSSSLQARTRVKTLTKETLADNFDVESGTRFAITMGIGTILEAREIILVATGESKAHVIQSTVEGPVSASCPASALQFHPKTRIILDESAARLLVRKDYYKWVFAHKHEVNIICSQSGENKKD